jgi:hypothetical protein
MPLYITNTQPRRNCTRLSCCTAQLLSDVQGVAFWWYTNVSEECAASIFRVRNLMGYIGLVGEIRVVMSFKQIPFWSVPVREVRSELYQVAYLKTVRVT